MTKQEILNYLYFILRENNTNSTFDENTEIIPALNRGQIQIAKRIKLPTLFSTYSTQIPFTKLTTSSQHGDTVIHITDDDQVQLLYKGQILIIDNTPEKVTISKTEPISPNLTLQQPLFYDHTENSTVAGASIQLPQDFLKISFAKLFNQNITKTLKPDNIKTLEENLSPSIGIPAFYSLSTLSTEGRWTLNIYPAVNDKYNITIGYYKIPKDFSQLQPTDTPELPAEFHPLIPKWAAFELLTADNNPNKAIQLRRQFEEELYKLTPRNPLQDNTIKHFSRL